MLRSVMGARWVKRTLGVSLAAVLVLLGSRSTVDSISTLVRAHGRSSGPAPGRTSEAGAVDRQPKPTRQQDRQTISSLDQLKWVSLSRPVLPGLSAWDRGLPSPAAPVSWTSDSDLVQATMPSYLRPCDILPLGQLPPPTLASA